MTTFRVCASDRVQAGRVFVGRAGTKQVALTRLGDGAAVAFQNLCPHAGTPLSGGLLRGTTIECPRHAWKFDILSGKCPEHDIYSLRRYVVTEMNGWIEIEVPEEIW